MAPTSPDLEGTNVFNGVHDVFVLVGSAIALGSAVAPLFIQMGIYDEFVKRGKYYNEVHLLKEDLTPVQKMDTTWLKDV